MMVSCVSMFLIESVCEGEGKGAQVDVRGVCV